MHAIQFYLKLFTETTERKQHLLMFRNFQSLYQEHEVTWHKAKFLRVRISPPLPSPLSLTNGLLFGAFFSFPRYWTRIFWNSCTEILARRCAKMRRKEYGRHGKTVERFSPRPQDVTVRCGWGPVSYSSDNVEPTTVNFAQSFVWKSQGKTNQVQSS